MKFALLLLFVPTVVAAQTQATPVANDSEIFDFADLAAFLKVYDIICASIRTPDDFRRVTYEALKRCADSNVRYTEFFFSPGAHLPYGVKYSEMLDGRSEDLPVNELAGGARIRHIFLDIFMNGLQDLNRSR